MGWALNSDGWWFLLTFGLLGSGELFGAYFPNYVTTASEKEFVRVNMAYLSVLSTLTGFSSLAFGLISDNFGRPASFYVSAAMLVLALLLISLLPANPTPRGSPWRCSAKRC
jgi:MFS family permease